MHFKRGFVILLVSLGAFVARADILCNQAVAKLLYGPVSKIEWKRQLRIDNVWSPADSKHQTTVVFFKDTTHLFDVPTIWNESQQQKVAEIILATQDNEIAFNGRTYEKEALLFFGNEIAKALQTRITDFMEAINRNKPPADQFRLTSVSIHLQNARSFTGFHRHGGGDITIAFAEVGYVTEVAGIPLERYRSGGQIAIISDGVLHRPNILNEGDKLIVFAQLTPAF